MAYSFQDGLVNFSLPLTEEHLFMLHHLLLCSTFLFIQLKSLYVSPGCQQQHSDVSSHFFIKMLQVEGKKQDRLSRMHSVQYSAHSLLYVIPSSVPVHLCILCLFVLYPVPSAICHPQLRYHSRHRALTSRLFSGPNKDLTDKHSQVLEFTMKVSKQRLAYCFTDPLSVWPQTLSRANTFQRKNFF